MLLLKVRCTDLHAHTAGDLAHGGEQGEGVGTVAHGLIRNAGDLLLEEGIGQLAEGSEMQVGEENQALAEVAILLLDGLLLP